MLQPPAHATNRAVTPQSSQLRALLLLLVVLIHPSLPQLITRASASASASGGSTRRHAWHCPEHNQHVAVLSSAAARMQKTPFRHPSHSTTSPDVPDITTGIHSVVARPPDTAVAVLGNPKSQEAGILTGARYRPGFGFLSLTQPAELLVIILGTGRRGLSPGSLVPPESARRTESGWGQSGCSQPGGGGMAAVHFPALSYSTP